MDPFRYLRNPAVLWREERHGGEGGEAAALLYLDTDIVTINGVGLDVWRLCDGMTVDEIVDRLMEAYEIDRQTLTDDVLRFLGEMAERRLVTHV
jgi:GeoRSP system PqqD family protein